MMRLTLIFAISGILSLTLHAADSMYCPGNHSYINLGMSQTQVTQACGAPVNKKKSNQPVTQKVNVTQLIYNNKGTSKAFFGVWQLSTGSSGIRLEVDLVDNKVAAVRVNGSSVNAFSVCESNIQIGDPASAVYNNCGSPSITNNTYVRQPVPGKQTVEIWTYQPGDFQNSFSLTFVNGKLQSIANQ